MKKKLYKSNEKMLDGVVAGIADYIGMDPTLGRVLMVLIALFTGFIPALIFYAVCMFIMPDKNDPNANVFEGEFHEK